MQNKLTISLACPRCITNWQNRAICRNSITLPLLLSSFTRGSFFQPFPPSLSRWLPSAQSFIPFRAETAILMWSRGEIDVEYRIARIRAVHRRESIYRCRVVSRSRKMNGIRWYEIVNTTGLKLNRNTENKKQTYLGIVTAPGSCPNWTLWLTIIHDH